MGAMVVVLSVVMYFLVAVGYTTTNYFVSHEAAAASFGDYNEILSTWFERNVLLENTIWPRKSYLVFLSPESSDFSIGRDVQPPGLRVLAWEYVIADQHAKNREGWRLLTWKDLETKKELLGDPPAAVAPEDWKNVRDPNVGLTVDEVKLFFGKFDIRKGDNPTTDGDKTAYTFPDGQKLPFKWAIPGKPEEGWEQGWRPLTWRELTSDKLHVSNAVPSLPTDWAAPLTPSIGYTIDEVETANAANPIADITNVLKQLDRLYDMRKTIDRLDGRLADSSMRRKVRKLIVPSKVTVTVKGRAATSTLTLDSMPDNEYTGQFGELKEKNLKDAWTFKYYASGEDYSTANRKITIVPPPTLQELFREDEQPAYLFYRWGNPSNATAEDIKGKRQPLARRTVSLMGGEIVTLDCPAGTNLTLIGTTDKNLASVEFTPTEAGNEPEPQIHLDKPREFHVTLPNVRQKRDYTLKMLDTDGVSGKRTIRITVKRDDEPSVDVDVDDWVRRTKEGLMVTAKARIPFKGNIKDDNGLLRINYAYTVAKMESTAVLDVKALNAATNLVGQMMPGTSGPLQGLVYLEHALDDIEKTKVGAAGPEGMKVRYFPSDRDDKPLSIPRFDQELKDEVAHPDEFLPLAVILTNLKKPQPAPFRSLFSDLKKFEPDPMAYELAADPFVADFNVAKAMEKLVPPMGSVQPRYRMTLWVEATDTDLDSTRAIDGQDGPKTASSKVRYQVVIVPEDELQAEISKDEAELTVTMSGALEKLREVRDKLKVVRGDLENRPAKPEDRLKPENLGPLAIRTAALDEAIGSSQASAKEVLMKYQGLFKELKGNDIQGNKIKTVLEEIIEPLDKADRTGFSDAHDKMQALRGDLSGKDKFEDVVARAQKSAEAADKQVQALIDTLQLVLEKMEKQIELNKLVQDLRVQLQHLQRDKEIVDRIKKWKLEQLDKGS